MAEYQRFPQRFENAGQTTRPRDLAQPGKQQLIENLRPYTPGTLEVRAGLRQLTSSPFTGLIHTLARIVDGVTADQMRLAGVDGQIFAGAVADPQTFGTALDSGYSGNPLTVVDAQPIRSTRPFLYVADRSRYRKVLADRTLYSVGLAPPTGPPATVVSKPLTTVVDLIDDATHWSGAGSATSPTATAVSRVNTTVSKIRYDYLPASWTVATTGPCAIIPASPTAIQEGMLLTVDGELTVVEEILIKIASTTIASIVYDSGTSGPCCIYPTGSLGTGQLETPPLDVFRIRNPGSFAQNSFPGRGPAHTLVQAVIHEVAREIDFAGVTRVPAGQTGKTIRQVDFPVGCLVTIGTGGTAETLPIVSVHVDRDGFQAFRCTTVNTHSAGETIVGSGPGFRCNLSHTVSPGAAITAGALHVTITPTVLDPLVPAPVTGGIQRGAVIDLSTVGGRASTAEDYVRFQIRVDLMHTVKAVRLYLDVNPTTQNFLENYYVHEWAANDLIAAIQATNTGETQTFQSVGLEAIIQRDYDRARRFGLDFRVTAEYLDRVTKMIQDQTFQQLALGDNQWVALEAPLREFTRVGTEEGLTTANILAAQILVIANTADPLTAFFSGLYLTGGYGPDVGRVGDPYVYRYRYRSSITGEVSNPSPVTRNSSIARRQAVSLYATPSSAAQADLLDWFRLGGSLTRWTYVDSSPNTTDPFLDTVPDIAIDGGETLPFDDFQPWPVLDQSKKGVATVAGNAIQRTSGDLFNLAWAPGTQILINGHIGTIDQVRSTSVLLTVENLGTGTGLSFLIPEPQIQAQPLQMVWATPEGLLFACGDALNPGTVYWTKPNNPDVTSDRNSVFVTPPSDPLEAGFTWDGRNYVVSSANLFELREVSPGSWQPTLTACGKGFWTPWAFAVAPEGTYFLGKDGIYLTRGGSEAESLTKADLDDLFPHDGIPGRSVGGIIAPDMSNRPRLRLSWVDQILYFDYLGIDTLDHTLIYDPARQAWTQDLYATGGGVKVRLAEPGLAVHDQVVGLAQHLGISDAAVHTDLGSPIPWRWQSAEADGGDTRLVKQWGDAVLDMDPKGDTITVQPVFDHGSVTLSAQTRSGSGRQPFVIDVNDGAGQLARSMALLVSGTTSTNPVLYLWEPAALPKASKTTRRATDWDDLGVQGAKFIQGIILRANTFNTAKSILVQGDGATALTLSITHNGEVTKAYPLASTGWTPFVAHLVRLWPSGDDVNWLPLDYRWIFEPAPELATEWTTQSTTHDLPGYLHVRDAFFAYSDAASAITFEVLYDGTSVPVTITPPGTAYQRVYTILPSYKGRSVSYRWRSNTPFRLYRKDTSVRVHSWGDPRGYQIASPFGGESRQAGAQV